MVKPTSHSIPILIYYFHYYTFTLTFLYSALSQEGQDYLAAMAAAANYAWVNRSSMTFLVRQAFAKQFGREPDDLDMHVVYDVSHNIAKVRVRWEFLI